MIHTREEKEEEEEEEEHGEKIRIKSRCQGNSTSGPAPSFSLIYLLSW